MCLDYPWRFKVCIMEAENYSVVDDDGNIVNVIIWNGVSKWSPPDGCTADRCGENLCAIG